MCIIEADNSLTLHPIGYERFSKSTRNTMSLQMVTGFNYKLKCNEPTNAMMLNSAKYTGSILDK